MEILIVNFSLNGLSRSEYESICDEVAPAFAAAPGLISKHWLADEANNTYGGIYLWESQQALDNFLSSELFENVSSNPAFADAKVRPFNVLERPTRVTRGIGV